MGKRLLIFAIIFLSLLAFTIWRAQPPFRLQRKLLAKLPYELRAMCSSLTLMTMVILK
jgi:hypothetical protein